MSNPNPKVCSCTVVSKNHQKPKLPSRYKRNMFKSRAISFRLMCFSFNHFPKKDLENVFDYSLSTSDLNLHKSLMPSTDLAVINYYHAHPCIYRFNHIANAQVFHYIFSSFPRREIETKFQNFIQIGRAHV